MLDFGNRNLGRDGTLVFIMKFSEQSLIFDVLLLSFIKGLIESVVLPLYRENINFVHMYEGNKFVCVN